MVSDPRHLEALTAAATLLARLPLVTHHLEIGGRDWAIEAVADQSALTGLADEFAHFPFGLLLWDAAPVLAGALAARGAELSGKCVLELGAGVGLCGLVARWCGAELLQTDHGAEALALCQANARRNGITGMRWAEVDWRNWHATETFDLIMGSDILYEPDLHANVMSVLAGSLAPGGHVLLTDPGRSTTPRFISRLEAAGWQLTRRRQRVPALVPVKPGETVVVTLIEAWR